MNIPVNHGDIIMVTDENGAEVAVAWEAIDAIGFGGDDKAFLLVGKHRIRINHGYEAIMKIVQSSNFSDVR